MSEQQRSGDARQLVVFQLADERYGAEIRVVREIVPMQKVTAMPGMPEYALGVTDLRGRVLPVIDLKRRLALPDRAGTSETRIMVVEVGSGEIGCIVDAVDQVLTVSADAVEAPPAGITPRLGGVSGIAKVGTGLVALLDLEAVLRADFPQAV